MAKATKAALAQFMRTTKSAKSGKQFDKLMESEMESEKLIAKDLADFQKLLHNQLEEVKKLKGKGTGSRKAKTLIQDLLQSTSDLKTTLEGAPDIKQVQSVVAMHQRLSLELARSVDKRNGNDKFGELVDKKNREFLALIAERFSTEFQKKELKTSEKIDKRLGGLKYSGVSSALTKGLGGGLLSAMGLGPFAKDILEMTGVEEKIDKMFTRGAYHKQRVRQRAFNKKLGGLEGTPNDAVNAVYANGKLGSSGLGDDAIEDLTGNSAQAKQRRNKQERRARIMEDTTTDFMRSSLKQAEATTDTLKEIEDNTEGSKIGSILSGISKVFSPLFRLLMRPIGMLTTAAMALVKLIPGLGALFGGGGGDASVEIPDGPDMKKGTPKGTPKGPGRLAKGLGKLKNFGKALGGRAASVGSKALQAGARFLPLAARGVGAVLSAPATALAGAGLAGYQVGSAIHDRYGEQIGNGVDATASGIGKAWETAKNFITGGKSVADIIKEAATRTQTDYGTLMAFAKQESGFNPNAKAGTSSAAGLFQFTKGTWAQMVKKYGGIWDIGMGDIMDPLANATMGALYIKENTGTLRKAGIPINGTSLYAAHFLGPGGARQLFSANPSAIAADLLPAAASANKNIFFANGRAKTVGEVINTLFNKVGKNVDAFSSAVNTGAATGASATAATQSASASATPATQATAAALPGANVKRTPSMPQVVQAPAQSAPVAAAPQAQTQSQPRLGIDSIPMFVDDTGLVIITAGGII